MRWPLMLRTTHDALMAARDAELTRVTEALARTIERESATLTKLADLTIAKLTPPAPLPKREPDALTTAMMLRANGDRGLLRYLGEFAKRRRLEGAAPDDIIAEITRGEQSDDDEDGVML